MAELMVLACTQNAHKLGEFRDLFPDWAIDALDAGPYPEEDGETYLDNALIKARFGRGHASAHAWVLADDSGIELDALEGGPGVVTARWAGGEHVARALAAVEGRGRGARYVCELVAIAPDGRELRGTGVLEGRIAAAPAGHEGFGFDPVFLPHGHDRTVAELGDGWKAQHSHRALAARALAAAVAAEGDPPEPR